MGRRPSGSPPSYRLHKQSGQAVVSLPLGGGKYRDVLLGRHGSPDSKREYARVIAEWTAGRPAPLRSPSAPATPDVTVNEALLAYLKFAAGYYVKNGRPTKQLDRVRRALKPVRELYGHTAAKDFGPVALKTVRARMIAAGWCRPVVNSHVGCVKRCFKWSVENELVPPHVWHGLQAVAGLRKGRCETPEPDPVGPVDDEHVEAALPFLTPPVAAMVRLQRLTGMRPGEVMILRPCDVDATGEVWSYTPSTHKTEHHGADRVVFLGPRARQVLAPFLSDRPPDSYCFAPREGMAAFRAGQRTARKSKVQPSQADRRKRRPKRTPGEHYTSDSYGHAVAAACRRADAPRWHPNQLRHTFATEARRLHGLEACQVLLGHARADVTQHYAERNYTLAAAVAGQIG